MTSYLYNILWCFIRPFIGIILRRREKCGKEFASRRIERYGQTTTPIKIHDNNQTSRIWLNAVSVGESVAALRLTSALSKLFPSYDFLITTNTNTGYNLIITAINDNPDLSIKCVMQPLDHPSFVDSFLSTWKPNAAIFIESDFWPNLILRTKQLGIPVIFASSQLSEQAALNWKRFPKFALKVFGSADLILPVDNTQAKIFHTIIGIKNIIPLIKVIGSLKLPVLKPPDPKLRKILKKATAERRIFLAASTHVGEDKIIIDAARKLGTSWLTIIAPRHPTRGDSISKLAKQAPQRSRGELPNHQTTIYIMDSLGEMSTLFSLANYVFLGGSLVPSGGHNPLEPASFGLPILTGTHILKNKAEFEGLAAKGAIFEVSDAQTIVNQIIKLEADPFHRTALAKAAKKYVAVAHQRSSLAAKAIESTIKNKKQPSFTQQIDHKSYV